MMKEMYFDDTKPVAGNFALCVEYDGRNFSGWQVQKKPPVRTVQGELEKAISKVADQLVTTHCAGRTDAGVHGTGQIVSFRCDNPRTEKAWVRGINANLPDDVCIRWSSVVPDDFHARFTATARTYRYFILNRAVRSAFWAGRATHETRPLDEEKMQQASACLLGELDFSAFRGAGCQSSSPFRYVHYIDIKRTGDWVVVEIKANAFLLHMVRNIMGVLMDIGAGIKPIEWCQDVLESKDRKQASVTARPDGLCLVHVDYPESLNFPELEPAAIHLL